jgi:hypothetical protein
MFISDPGSKFLSILDPGSRIQQQKQKKRGKIGKNWKKFVLPFLCHKYHKKFLKNTEFLKGTEKKCEPIHRELYCSTFTQKIFTKPSKIWVWGPGSEIQDPENPYFGSRI